MMSAMSDLHNFLYNAARGICDNQEQVKIEATQNGKMVTLVIGCAKEDLRFVYSKLQHLKAISIAIAQRNRAMVTVVVNDGDDYVESM